MWALASVRVNPQFSKLLLNMMLLKMVYSSQVTAVGHAAILAAIQKYVPALVCFSASKGTTKSISSTFSLMNRSTRAF